MTAKKKVATRKATKKKTAKGKASPPVKSAKARKATRKKVAKKKVGRPTKHTDAVLALAREYIENWRGLGDAIPQVAGLALHCGVSRQRVYEWMKDDDKPEFRDIATRVQCSQERSLVNGSLLGDFNPKIAGMMLGKHGYSEKQDITSGDEKIETGCIYYPASVKPVVADDDRKR